MNSLPQAPPDLSAAQLPLPFEKQCTVCGKTKPLSAFYARRDARAGLTGRCKECTRAAARAYHRKRRDDPLYHEKHNAAARNFYRRNADAVRPKSAVRQLHVAQQRRAAGLCPWCAEPTAEGKSACAVHLALARQSAARTRADRVARRVCLDCGRAGDIEADVEGARRRRRKNVYCQRCYLSVLANGATGRRGLGPALWAKLVAQDYTCPYTGERLILGVNASIDHIQPRSRYPQLRACLDNLEWVTMRVNILKRDKTKEEFLALLRCIVAWQDYASLSPLFDSAHIG